MRFGCCGNMISPHRDPLGGGIVEELAASGFDYLELSLRDLAALVEPDMAQLQKRIEMAGIRCEACNNFFPAAVRLTGPEASLPGAIEYATRALERAARIGVSIVVFGSSDAKNVPPGYPYADAWRQIVALLQALGPVAGKLGITIVIEPLNRRESNIVCTAAEGLKLVREVAHPSIQLLIDYYHLRLEKEDPGIVLEAGKAVRHVHFAEPAGRVFPLEASPAYESFFAHLQQIGYNARCSIEAYTRDFSSDARRALAILKAATEGKTAEAQNAPALSGRS